MADDRIVKLKLGYKEFTKEVEVTIPDDEPTPWDMNTELSVVGTRVEKVDAHQKVTGKAKYTHDRNLKGMLYGGFVRAPFARGVMRFIDLSAVEKHPEVKAVMPMSVQRVRYYGQPLAAIAATSRQALEEAIKLAKLGFDEEPHAARLDVAMADNAPQVNKAKPNVSGGRKPRRLSQVLEALESGEYKKVELECRTQVQTHSCLETHGTVAHWEDDQLTVWTSTQATFGVRNQLSRSLRDGDRPYPQSKIRVFSEYMGGGFGSKFMAGYWSVAAARLAKMAKRPVKVMLDRREEQTDTGNRPDSIQTMKLGVTKDGKLGPYHVEKTGTPGIGRRASATNPMIYSFPRGMTASRQAEVATNAGAQQAFRGPGHPQGSFALEAIIDLAAAAAGQDPLAFRMANDDHPIRAFQYKDGAERIGWENRKPDGSATGRFRVGYGVASSKWGNFGGPRAEVQCRIMPDGSVEVRSGAQDIGTGTRTVLAIVSAEELGLTPSDITTFIGDTNDPIGPGSGGSRTCSSMAPAIRQSAFLAGGELRELVAQNLECKAEDLVFTKGRIQHSSDKSKGLPFKEACKLIRDAEISAVGKRKRNYTRRSMLLSEVGGCQFVKVTVDCDFGTVKVDKVVALQDCGKVINAATAEGQVLGGVIQGISYALFEDRVMDRHKGAMINSDLEMYKIAGSCDMPEIETVLYDVAIGDNNCSVAGIGEPTMIPTAAAIGNAIANATGVRVASLPLTPDKVLNAFDEAGK